MSIYPDEKNVSVPYTPATASTDESPLFQWPDLDFKDLEDIYLGRQVPVVGSPPEESENSTNDLPRPFAETDAETNMLEEDMAAQIPQKLSHIVGGRGCLEKERNASLRELEIISLDC